MYICEHLLTILKLRWGKTSQWNPQVDDGSQSIHGKHVKPLTLTGTMTGPSTEKTRAKPSDDDNNSQVVIIVFYIYVYIHMHFSYSLDSTFQ